MKINIKISVLSTLLLFCITTFFIQAQEGEELFKPCAACHSIGGGRMIGPDLKGVTRLRTNEWLIRFIQSPVGMLKSGDQQAKAIFTEFNNVPMPDNKLTAEQINKILAFIDGGLSGGINNIDPAMKALQQKVDSILKTNSSYDINKGFALFNGSIRFSNGGTSCIACHNVSYNNISRGGTLAKDLSKSFTRLNGFAGLKGIIGVPPFPSMAIAYKHNELTEEEIAYLQLFLKSADAQNLVEPIVQKTWFFHFALISGLFLILSIALIWYRRKRKSVNDEILKRQERFSR
ncbi:MAG: cytochrome c [Bacteroidales bacterium]|nr:cytochrome c [Bacteroidales bacterium]